MNSPGRGRFNKSNIQTTDWDIILLNTFINTISDSDLQRYGLGVNNMGMLEKMVSGGGRILDIIKLIIEYDILIISSIILRARTEIITEGLNNNFITILENRISNSELSNVLKNFKNIIVNNNNIKES